MGKKYGHRCHIFTNLGWVWCPLGGKSSPPSLTCRGKGCGFWSAERRHGPMSRMAGFEPSSPSRFVSLKGIAKLRHSAKPPKGPAKVSIRTSTILSFRVTRPQSAYALNLSDLFLLPGHFAFSFNVINKKTHMAHLAIFRIFPISCMFSVKSWSRKGFPKHGTTLVIDLLGSDGSSRRLVDLRRNQWAKLSLRSWLAQVIQASVFVLFGR